MAGSKGGRGGKAGSNSVAATYEKIPLVFALGGTPTAEEKKQRKDTVSKFMNDAKAGDVYKVGSGFGSAGAQFEVVERRGKLALKWSNSNRQPVQMNRANVEDFIRNGATLIQRKR